MMNTSEPLTDEEVAELTRRLTRLEPEAWVQFHSQYAPRLYRYLLVMAPGCEADAQDALQNTLLRAVRYIRRFESETAFWSWLTVLARSARWDHARKEGRLTRFLRRWRWHVDAEPVSAPIPGTGETPAFGPRQWGTCLEALHPEDRALLDEKYLAGSSVREMAEKLGTTEKAIESRLGRLRIQLREKLRKLLDHESTI